MAFQEFVPHPALRPFVDRYWTRSAEVGPGGEPPPAVRILPDGYIDVMVDLTRGEAVAIGTMTRAFSFVPEAPLRRVAVRFRPGGAVPFLRVPAAELTDRFVDVALLGLDWLAPQRLAGLACAREAVGALEGALLGRLGHVAPDLRVAHAIRALLRPGPASVHALARELGWSRQHLRRVLLNHVGVGPRQLGRVARLHRAVDAVQGGAGSLADAAVRTGYYDQAHMARDFRDLVGVPPAVVRASAGSIRPIHSLLHGASFGL